MNLIRQSFKISSNNKCTDYNWFNQNMRETKCVGKYYQKERAVESSKS